MGSLLQGTFFIEKFYAVTTARAAIDINDVLHYYQFHFVLIFCTHFKLKRALCMPLWPRVPVGIMIRQFSSCSFLSRSSLHSRNLRLHLQTNVSVVFHFEKRFGKVFHSIVGRKSIVDVDACRKFLQTLEPT